MIRVLFVTTDSSAVAGVGRSLLDLLQHVDRDRLAPIVVCPGTLGRRPSVVPEIERLSIPVHVRALGKWLPSSRNWGASHLVALLSTLRSRIWALTHLIEREHIDVVYTNGLTCMDAALAARQTRRPHVWHVRESPRDRSNLRSYLPPRLVAKTVRALSDAVVVNSGYLARDFGGVGAGHLVHVVHNGIDTDGFASSASDERAKALRREVGVPPDGLLVVAVGTVAPHKGYDMLARAARCVLDGAPDVRFAVAGALIDPHASQLRDQLAAQGVADRFALLGARTDIADLLAAADVFVHSARNEAFGRVLVEAMALGKPVVATRCGGPEEIVVDGKTGYLVAVDDWQTMAQKITTLLERRDLRQALGSAGRERARDDFSVAMHAERIQQVIASVAGGSPRTPVPGGA